MRYAAARRQRGAVAIMTGLTIAVLIAFLGIAVDLGRLFVFKAELQTAMDACALAAASGLRPGLNDPNALNRARAFGKAPSDASMLALSGTARGESVNQVMFQWDNLDSNRIQFSFGSRMDNISAGWTDVNTARYARCAYPLNGIVVHFMRLVGGARTADVDAQAVATMRESSGPACVLPMVLCNKSGSTNPAARWGLTIGEWQRAVQQNNQNDLGPGKFGWANLDGGPGSATEIRGWIEGGGYCETLSNITLTSGAKTGVESAWNSRFGIYKNGAGNPQPATERPDYTGYSYDTNWAGNNWWTASSTVFNAFSGTDQSAIGGAAEGNYSAKNSVRAPYQSTIPGYHTYLSAAERVNAENRRIVPVPVLDCSGSAPFTRLGMACVLLLSPITDPKDASVEFLGRADEVGACSTSGSAGGSGGTGAFVPVLVQ